MKPVDQIILDPKTGDCLRASMASIFELDFQQVPHFMLFKNWETVVAGFVWAMGYNWILSGDPEEHKIKTEDTVNGFTEACVPSKNYLGVFHSVVIDTKGNVVHDPRPEKKWQGINVFQSGDIVSWMIFEPNENHKDQA